MADDMNRATMTDDMNRAAGSESMNWSGPSSSDPMETWEGLLPGPELETLRNQWREIQGLFVDEPRVAVERADQLVATVIQRLNETFADQRARLESAWEERDDTSTEDLRQALRRYRSFFDHLLAV